MTLPLADVVLSGFQGLALLLTLFRVIFRVKIGRFWWEDAWASLAFICGILCIVTLYTHETVNNGNTIIVSGFIFLYAWPGIIWSVRLSLLASIARVVQPGRLRLLILTSGWFFAVLYLALAAQKTYVCANTLMQFREGGSEGKFTCIPDRTMAICEVTADVISDTIAIVLPLRVLWSVRLQTRQRRMIMAIFSSSAAVTVISILHSVAEIAASLAPWQGIATMVEILVSLIVCNLLVIVTLLYRRVVKIPTHNTEATPFTTVNEIDDSDDDDFAGPARASRSSTGSNVWTRFLTIVELTFSTGRWTVSAAGNSTKD